MPSPTKFTHSRAAIIGAGPAGMMAAEVLCQAGVPVDLYEAKTSPGRKFLVAGKGGLNITHSEPIAAFLARYGSRAPQLEPYLLAFGPQEVRQWLHDLGFETYVGSSGRVFPEVMHAGPILYAWKTRLQSAGVAFYLQHHWLGWDARGALQFEAPQGLHKVPAEAVVLALGGGSWPQLGSTGDWVPQLAAKGVPVAPLRPANCGFEVAWSEVMRTRYAGQPVKSVVLSFTGADGRRFSQQGEFIITEYGVEGSLIYAASALLRDAIGAHGRAVITLDLAPDWSLQRLTGRISRPRGARTISSHLTRAVGLRGVKAALLWEILDRAVFNDPPRLAAAIKGLRVPLLAARPLAEAISSAGGVRFEALDAHLMLSALPGVFCAGEMLDWEAPTGGYLLTACLATGRAAGLGAAAWLRDRVQPGGPGGEAA